MSISITVDVDLDEFETSDLIDEIESRGKVYQQYLDSVTDEKFSYLLQRIRSAIITGDDKKLCELTKEYFYERYFIIGRAS